MFIRYYIKDDCNDNRSNNRISFSDSDFTDAEANEIVASMKHTYDYGLYKGEQFTRKDAEDLFEHYSGKYHIPSLNHLYIALNAQYHDYHNVFCKYLKCENIEDLVVCSCLEFWFGDEDYSGDKVLNYFKHK
jgi:hypothetical protein